MQQHFDAEWNRCAGWLLAALEYDQCHDLSDVKAKVLADECQFWPGLKSAIVTEVIDTPKVRSLHIWLVGGDLKELVGDMLPVITDFAKRAGCSRMSVAGRKGWERVLLGKGFVPAWRVAMKELT